MPLRLRARHQPGYPLEAYRLVAENYYSKGKTHGLKPGLGVIFKGGVIGRTTSVNSRSSEIELITNPTFRIVAHFQGDNRPITFQGIGIAGGGSPEE